MLIDLRQIPPDGLVIEGEEAADVLHLTEPDLLRPASPIRYRLTAVLQDGDLLVQGWIESIFDLRCVRCLEYFTKTIRLDPYVLLEPAENRGTLDLTERLREDILLDLPGYPRCEQADCPRECRPLDSFPPDSEHRAIEKRDQGVWKILDGLEPPAREKSESD